MSLIYKQTVPLIFKTLCEWQHVELNFLSITVNIFSTQIRKYFIPLESNIIPKEVYLIKFFEI